MLGDAAADAGDLLQLAFAPGIGFLPGHLLGQCGIAVGQGDDALGHQEQGLEEVVLVDRPRVREVQARTARLDRLGDPPDPRPEHPGVARRGLPPAAHRLPVDVDHAVVPEDRGLFRSLRKPLLVDRTTLPVGPDLLLEELAVFGPQEERVVPPGADGVQLPVQHGPAGIGAEDPAADLAAGIADDQFIVGDEDGLLEALFPEGVRLLHDQGMSFHFLEAAGEKRRVLQVHFRPGAHQAGLQPLDPIQVFRHDRPPFGLLTNLPGTRRFAFREGLAGHIHQPKKTHWSVSS